jgi:hypothetical protein
MRLLIRFRGVSPRNKEGEFKRRKGAFTDPVEKTEEALTASKG